MDQRLSVSVAMCTHNGGEYIRSQIESILNQTVAVSELVVSDDASTDDTIAQVRDAFNRHSRGTSGRPNLVVVENGSPLGIAKNFEQAISATTGDLILLADQDDVWRADKVWRLLTEFEARPEVSLIFTNARLVDSRGESLGQTLFSALEITRRESRLLQSGQAFKALLPRNLATGATVMFRRRLFERARAFPDGWLHDEWLAIVAAAYDSISCLDETLIDYRQHQSNQIGAVRLSLRAKFAKLFVSRAERNFMQYVRARELKRVLGETQDISRDYRLLIQDKFKFELRRMNLPAKRFARGPFILIMLLEGQYRRFGRGLKDSLRNLVQPD